MQKTGGSQMNTLKDIETIVRELTELIQYHAQAKASMKPFEWRQTAKEAMGHVDELEEKLVKLKLSTEDRKHFSKLREAFSEFKNGMKWESRGNSVVALVAFTKGRQAVDEYRRRIKK